jgi:alpha-glucoside transport system permease protein
VAGLLWRFLLIDNFGIVNEILKSVGIIQSSDQIQWLSDPNIALFSVAIPDIWLTTSFITLVLFAGLQNIPGDVIEAARLDGVGGFRMFRYVTIPVIRPALVVVVTTIAITTLKVFDIVRTMTGGQFSTSVVANEFYVQGFRQFNVGLGASMAVLLFVLVIPIVVYNIRQMRLSEDMR